MTAVFSTVLLALALGAEPSGIGLPLGIPPAPADPVIARVAPEKCLFYVNWAGTAAPDPNSASQAEQLLAEPEVQQVLAGVGKGIKAAMIGATKEASAFKWVSGEEAFQCLSILLTHSTAIFMSDVKITRKEVKSAVAATKKAPAEDSPEVLEVDTSVKLRIRGGMVVSLGPQAAGMKARAEKSLDKFLMAYKCEEVNFEHVRIAGQTWYRVKSKLGAGGPSVVFGFKGDRFIAGFGEGSLEAILARTDRQPPAWLTAALADVPVERRTGVIYLNLKALREKFIGSQLDTSDSRAIVGMLGLDNAEALVSTTGLDASGYVNKALLALEGPPRGLLRLVSDGPLRPEDLAPIPRDATLALAVRFDLQQAVQIILTAIDAMSPERRAGLNQAFDQIGRDLGVDLRRGLLPALGDTWCIYNSPGEGGLVVTGLTAVVPIRNHQVLSAAYGKLVDLVKKNLAAGPDTGSAFGLAGLNSFRHFTFAGREICYVNCGFLAPAWCLTPQELVMALNPYNVKAYLSRREHKSLATVPEVARVLGPSGGPAMIGYTDAQAIRVVLSVGFAVRAVDGGDPGERTGFAAITRHAVGQAGPALVLAVSAGDQPAPAARSGDPPADHSRHRDHLSLQFSNWRRERAGILPVGGGFIARFIALGGVPSRSIAGCAGGEQAGRFCGESPAAAGRFHERNPARGRKAGDPARCRASQNDSAARRAPSAGAEAAAVGRISLPPRGAAGSRRKLAPRVWAAGGCNPGWAWASGPPPTAAKRAAGGAARRPCRAGWRPDRGSRPDRPSG